MKKLALAVDDSRTIRQMVSFTLQNIGYDVIEAEDGVEATKLMESRKPDIVITDLNMPNMDGITLIKHIRNVLGIRTVPILMLTTEYTDDKKNAGREAGATGWIVKPFDPEKLVQVVQKICG
jgi:two-component system chemotaxis response regulator CheY